SAKHPGEPRDNSIDMNILLAALLAAVVGGLVGYFGGRAAVQARFQQARGTAEEEAARIVAKAETDAENLRKAEVLMGKEAAFRAKEEWEREENRRREDVERTERRIQEREEILDRKFLLLDEKVQAQEQRLTALNEAEAGLGARNEEIR